MCEAAWQRGSRDCGAAMSLRLKSMNWLLGKGWKNDQDANTAELAKNLDMFSSFRRPSESLENLEHRGMEAEDIEKMEIEANELAKTREQDKRRIENLELELKTFSNCLGKLQQEINMKQLEANLVAEHVQSLEIKLADSDKLHEKITYLTEELAKSETGRLDLKQQLEEKKIELQHTIDYVRRLEEQFSENSITFEFEMESMRQNLVDSEKRYIKVNNAHEQETGEGKRMLDLINSLEDQLKNAQHTIDCLQKGHCKLQGDLAKSETKVTDFCRKLQEHLDQWLSKKNAMDHVIGVKCEHNVMNSAENKLPFDMQSSDTTRSEEDFEFLFSKLVTVKNMEEQATGELESMAQQLYQLHAIVAQLKECYSQEELREEKKKAKEEAEDLTQEMAELRYQLMEMLEQERELRACTEKASLHRIEELEAQRQQERQQLLIAIDRYHEAEKVAEAEAKEIEQLKLSLNRLKKLEQNLLNCHSKEVHFQTECGELFSQVDWLHEKLAAQEQEIQNDSEQHVEVLIQYEEEHGWMEAKADFSKKSLADQLTQAEQALAKKTAELDTIKKDLARYLWPSSQYDSYGFGGNEARVSLTRLEEGLRYEKQLCTDAEKKWMEVSSSLEEVLCKLSAAEIELDFSKQEIEHLQMIQQKTELQLSASLKEMSIGEGSIQRTHNNILVQAKLLQLREVGLTSQAAEYMKMLERVAALISEVQCLQQSLLSYQPFIAELNAKLHNFQETSLAERRKGSKILEERSGKTEKVSMQNNRMMQLQFKFNSSQNKIASLQEELNDARRNDKESLSLIERLNLELSLAKEEVAKSEVRIQRILKQSKQQLDSERRRHEELIRAKQTEQFTNK